MFSLQNYLTTTARFRETLEFIHVLILSSMIFGAFLILGSNLSLLWVLAWMALIVLVFFLPTIISSTRYISGSLNKKIKEERRVMCGGDGERLSQLNLSTIYNPSIFSALTIIVIGLIINIPAFYFPWYESFLSITTENKADYFNNLIAIHAGIGAIIFALLIFVAESLRDDAKERASVLLKESLLFPLTLLEIITFLALLGFSHLNLLVALPIFLVGCFAIYSLYKLIKILLSPYEFQKKRLNLLADRVKKSIDDAINERIGNNIIHKFLESDRTSLSASYISKRRKNEHVVFKVNEVGIIKDINMDVLTEIGEAVEAQANSKGFSFFERKAKPPAQSSKELETTSEVEYYLQLQKWEAALTMFYHDRLEPDSNSVLIVGVRIAGEDKVFEEKIYKLIEKLFVIGKEDNFSEEIKLELEGLRDQFVEAVKQEKITKIDYFNNVYLSLTETFLDLINECGGGFTPEQAKKEMSNFREGWSEIGWLDEHIRDVFLASLNTHNKEMIRKVSFIPLAIAIRGIRKNDHFIFQKFIRYATALYYHAHELEGHDSLRDDVAEHSITWMTEIADFYIESELEENPEKINFAFQILLQFQNILKHAFDKGDFKGFESAIEGYLALLKRFKPSEDHPNVEHLTWEYNRTEDIKQKTEIKERIETRQALEKAEKEFNDKKQQLVFGLMGWIFKTLRNSPDILENKRKFFDALRALLPVDIEGITKVFLEAHDHDVESFFGWTWWDVVADGQVRNMNIGEDVESLYVYLALESLVGKTPEQIASINLNPSRNLAYLAEKNSSLYGKFIDLTKVSNLNTFITSVAKEQVTALISLLERAKESQEEKEKLQIMERPLDASKVEEFKTIFLKEFYEHASLRSLFKRVGKFIDKSQTDDINPLEVDMRGYNQIDGKEAFFEDWHVHYVGWGEQYAEGFARPEDEMIYRKIAADLTHKERISFTNLIPTIEAILEKNKFVRPYLLSPFAYSVEMHQIRSSEKFVPKWNGQRNHGGLENHHSYIGFIDLKSQPVPIFAVIGPDKSRNRDACLVDMDKIGNFVQYPPIKSVNEKEFQKDVFMFKIIDLNQDDFERQKIMTDNPKWLQEKDNPDAYLRSKVLLNIYSKAEFVVDDTSAGVYITFKEKEEQLN